VVGRAIRSALSQQLANLEIIVVDDASTDQTSEYISIDFPEVRFLHQEVNQGVGAARNRGIREAANPWVVILDDDDELLPGALAMIAETLIAMPVNAEYPVLQFACSNGSIPQSYLLIALDHYVSGVLRGDFVPVINRELFIAEGLAYPEIRNVAGEHLLWWKVATKYGIPTWNQPMVVVHSDASIRLTSPENQIRLAKDHAELQERTLTEYGELLKAKFPLFYRTKRLGAATYWLLAGDHQKARKHLRAILHTSMSVGPLVLFGLSYFPLELAKWLFVVYRKCKGSA